MHRCMVLNLTVIVEANIVYLLKSLYQIELFIQTHKSLPFIRQDIAETAGADIIISLT